MRYLLYVIIVITTYLLFIQPARIVSANEEEPVHGRITEGEQVIRKRACNICHSFNGAGGLVGPDLTQVGIRRTGEWLFRWFSDPQEILPGTNMPRFEWGSDQEIWDVIAYLVDLKKTVDTAAILKSPTKEEAGRRLVEAYDCRACHRIGEGGRGRFPDLTHVGSKIYPQWEVNWLKDPQAIKQGTFMPTFPLSLKEREAIAAYLHTLK
ncbi:MAG: cytochrome c [Nitrospirae bacterium]|nr:cytochrome c [Nitrospirota bacterium]